MQPDTVLTLGDVAFQRFEVPERIRFGGEHKLVVHTLVGGARVIDAMGDVPSSIEWSGILTGRDAQVRANRIADLRKAGQALTLSWGGYLYLTVLRTLSFEYERFYQIRYSLALEVLQDMTDRDSLRAGIPALDEWIAQDMQTATGLADKVGDATLSHKVNVLDEAIAGISHVAEAAQSTLNHVLIPLSDVRRQVGILLAASSNTLRNVTTLGGILPGNPIAQQSSTLLNQISAVDQSPNLLQLDRVLGRMQSNLGSVNGGVGQVTQAGGNLYALAANQYHDASKWNVIAEANHMVDPHLSGIQTLVVPADQAGTGGILNV